MGGYTARSEAFGVMELVRPRTPKHHSSGYSICCSNVELWPPD
jgi:hypothetical protein